MADKILIVEDETALARFVELELSHEGYAVSKAADGREGLAMMESGEYDLMSYQHIAGELALHVIIAAAMSAMGKDESDSTLHSSMVANLNKDESRFPSQLIEIIGKFLMDYIIGTLNQYLGYCFKYCN